MGARKKRDVRELLQRREEKVRAGPRFQGKEYMEPQLAAIKQHTPVQCDCGDNGADLFQTYAQLRHSNELATSRVTLPYLV